MSSDQPQPIVCPNAHTDIVARLESATVADPEMAREVAAALFGPGFTISQVLMCRAALSDGIEAIGASLALVGERLPGWTACLLGSHRGDWTVVIDIGDQTTSEAPTAPLAVLLALFRALKANDGE